MKLPAKIIASILHPATLVLPAVFLIAYKESNSVAEAFRWGFVSLVFSGIVGLFVLIGVKKGFFSNFDVSIKKQRVILYPFTILITLLFAGFIFLFGGPTSLIFASLLFIAALIIFDIVNVRIKASVHVASISAIVVGIIASYSGMSYILLLLIPLVAWARIELRRHTLPETVVGAMLGIGLTVLAIFIVQLITA